MTTKSVKFASHSQQAPPDTKSTNGAAKPVVQMISPTRIKVGGKANPKRDIAIMIGVMALMIYWTKDFDGQSTTRAAQEAKGNVIANALNSMAESLSKRVVEGYKEQRQDPCGIFLASGSIPGTGESFFAGREYNVGDLLLETSLSYGLSLDDKTCVSLPSYSFLLKHHPYLHNVEIQTVTASNADDIGGGPTRYQLRAIKPISDGDELFLPEAQHPVSLTHNSVIQRVFDHIPTQGDYDLATEIIAQGIQTGNQMNWAQSRKQVQINPEHVYSLLRRTVSKLNKRIGALLPLKKSQADVHRDGTPSYFASLRNKTLVYLQKYGTCVNDVQRDLDDPTESSVVLQRKETKQNAVLLRVPILILPHDSSDAMCLVPEGFCLQQPNLPFRICPLVNMTSFPYGPEGNAELRWADKDVLKLQNDQLLNTHGLDLALEIIALKSLTKGEKACMSKVTRQLLSEHF